MLALALSWPRPVLLAELDPDGGTIAGWRAANPDPGLKTLAASGRHYLSPGLVVEHTQSLPSGVTVLMSPPSPDRCVAAFAALNPVGLGETLRSIAERDVLADCGRIDSNSPVLPVVHEADAVIFVMRAALVDIVGLRARLETLELDPSVRAGIVVVKGGPLALEDVAAAFTLPVVGTLEWDPRAASALNEGRLLLGRSRLAKSAHNLAGDLAAQLVSESSHARTGEPADRGPSANPVPSAAWNPPSDRQDADRAGAGRAPR
jgi:hypothetical protein